MQKTSGHFARMTLTQLWAGRVCEKGGFLHMQQRRFKTVSGRAGNRCRGTNFGGI